MRINIYRLFVNFFIYIKMSTKKAIPANFLKKSKDPRKENALKASMTHEINSLRRKQASLEEEIKQMKENYELEMEKLKENCISIIKQCQETFKKSIDSIHNNNFLIPINITNQYPILRQCLEYAANKTSPSPDFLNFCFMIYLVHNKTYQILTDFLPFIPESSCRKKLSSERNLLKASITDINLMDNMFPDAVQYTPLTLSGDAASIKPFGDKNLTSMYTYLACPLSKEYRSNSAHVCPCSSGTSSSEIVDKFTVISQKFERKGYEVKFWATDGDKAFDTIHKEWFKKVHEVFSMNISFGEKITLLKDYKRIPVSDPFHLLKNGRTHLLNHPILLDKHKMRCVNVALLQEAVKLGAVIADKSTIGAMKDSYILKLFSWDAFVKLLRAQRFDGAFYIAPFMFLLHVLKSTTLNKLDRFELLSLAIRQFYFYLNQVLDSNDDDSLFTPTFHNKTSIGTLFGTSEYIIRCINTCVAIAIAIEISDNCSFPLAVSRVSSFGVECHYGKVRLLFNYNHTFENAIAATVNAKILHRICGELNYKIHIRSRSNNAGAVLTNDILHGPCAPVDFSFIFDTLFFLFESVKMNRLQIQAFEYLVNNYSNYLQSTDFPQVRVASVHCGTMPHYRYVTNKYVQSLLPIPNLLNTKSPFDFFITDKKMNKRLTKIQNNQWFMKLICMIASIKFVGGDIIKYHFPRIYPTEENAEVYNTVSYWFETMMNKLPGEIEDSDDGPTINPTDVPDEDAIIRLDANYGKIVCTDVPCNSNSEPITMEFDENENDLVFINSPENDSQNDEPNASKEDIESKMQECIQAFMDHRIDLLKTKTKDYVLSRIYQDMETILSIIHLNQADFLANQLNDLDVTMIPTGPKNKNSSKPEEDNEDEEAPEIDHFIFDVQSDDEHETNEADDGPESTEE